MAKFLIGCKYYVRHLIKRFFSRSSSTISELTFKIVCNCNHELLIFFEDPAQRVHTIVRVATSKIADSN